jgi:hypothetical protein
MDELRFAEGQFIDFDFDVFIDLESRESVISECLEDHSVFY